MKTTKEERAGVSPYTPQNVDIAISHLERVLSVEGADSIFAQAYWRGRILQAYATRGLMRAQQERLQQLLDRLSSASTDFNPRAHVA
ncbi:Zn-dependent oligopeptidase [Caballeronia sp. SBC1]|uniref:Zn-dependent oligopeptidase n=1 Tax=Caballeronia sp. SBC1 TaxID=2705548 RepID=UPI00140C3FCD|nr:Zn-dependent oligopeptidase [Caballeronia sp. SBC1]